MVFNLKWRTMQNQCLLNVTQIYEMWARCPNFALDVLLNYLSPHLESTRSTFLGDQMFFCFFPPQLTGPISRNGGLETGCPCETSPESWAHNTKSLHESRMV